ncbi:hypothetical protein [Nocardioides lianchengensis]|uniref:Endonuclease/Exonuclease/phosphatase family protein n=1 Tax=Nocardioides lianchengensis TaxID=1045774 RepID=A0A1G6Z6T6_9ACTN|nr:hypothetical protein [Nocardioides lianchengensis]NYG11498.1 hypothetical protein [Nocardioides lianchengensis]SDD98241.1 Endonuclease/Exonuclease/phosphatase family protein [Nocardioides lianchengensis]
MSARPTSVRPVRALVAGVVVLLTSTLLAAPAGASDAAERRNTNPTGTRSGSLPNGAGNLKVRLAATADGRIRVGWDRSRAKQFKRYTVLVSPGRQMRTQVKAYRVSRKRSALVVDRAVGATPASGNYSFVKVYGVRRNGSKTASQTKWIQAPITSRCTAAARDQVTIGLFNVRTWAADRNLGPRRNWTHRGPNAIREILRSGAHAIAIQEASGSERLGFGKKPQKKWILDRLNATDPDKGARWVDALSDDAYRPPKGRVPGLVGTRVFYDASKYRKLDAGLARIVDPGFKKDSLIAWARLQSVRGDQAPFVLSSNHLRVGVVGSVKEWRIRARQTRKTIEVLGGLQRRFGGQVFLAGDLNSTNNTKPSNNVHQMLMRAGYYDAYATTRISGSKFPTTQDSKFPLYKTPLRRDYILSLGPVKGSCGYRNQIYRKPSRIASDHFMQVAQMPLA